MQVSVIVQVCDDCLIQVMVVTWTVNWCRWVDCTGVWRLPDTAERDRCHLWALVVWEVGQYDVLSQDEGALSVAQARQQDTAQQVLHQEGLDSWLYHSLITTDAIVGVSARDGIYAELAISVSLSVCHLGGSVKNGCS